MAPTLVMFALVYLGPMILALVSSFTKWDGMQSMRFIGLENYVKIFRDSVFHASLWHTLGIFGCGCACSFRCISGARLKKKEERLEIYQVGIHAS